MSSPCHPSTFTTDTRVFMNPVHSSPQFDIVANNGHFPSMSPGLNAIPCDKKPERRFSYAELLPMSSCSPSNDSDDYQTSNSCSSPPNDTKLATSSSLCDQTNSMAYVDQSSATMAAAANVSAVGVGTHQFYTLQHSAPLTPASHPSMLSSAVHPLTMMPYQHRHSIAGPSVPGPFTGPGGFFTQARHNSFSHPSFFKPNNPTHAGSTGMMSNLANMCMARPATPVSPMLPYTGQMFHNTKEDARNLMDMDYSYGFQQQQPPPFGIPVPSPTPTDEDQLNRAIKRKLDDRKTSKTPRSRGRRVSSIPSNGARMFTCKADGCGKVFKRSEHLKRHIRSIHTLEKPFQCPYHSCNKRFSRSDNLNQHIRIHRHSNAGLNNDKSDKLSTTISSSTASTTSSIPSAVDPATTNQHYPKFVQNYM